MSYNEQTGRLAVDDFVSLRSELRLASVCNIALGMRTVGRSAQYEGQGIRA